jgi:hypothetical protein
MLWLQAMPKMQHLPVLHVQANAYESSKRVSSKMPDVWWRNGVGENTICFL